MREVVIETIEEHIQAVDDLIVYLETSQSLSRLADGSVAADLAKDLLNALEELKDEIEDNEEQRELSYDE